MELVPFSVTAKHISRGMLGTHFLAEVPARTPKLVNKWERIGKRRGSMRHSWMETESKNKKWKEPRQNENEAELTLFARILLLVPDCLKRCASNHALAKIPLGCADLYSHLWGGFFPPLLWIYAHVNKSVPRSARPPPPCEGFSLDVTHYQIICASCVESGTRHREAWKEGAGGRGRTRI